MQKIVATSFGGPEVLQRVHGPDSEPGRGEVLIRVTSIGVNHADLMARTGQYKLVSGEPPFVPGLEAGGIIEAVGIDVSSRDIGQRVTLAADAPRGAGGGTYRSHYVCPAGLTIPVGPAPEQEGGPGVPDMQLGALWLSYLTGWGCLIWRQHLQQGQVVAMPAASSSTALAAAQIVRQVGGVPIGLTTSPGKIPILRALPQCRFEHLIATRDEAGKERNWRADLKDLTGGRGVDVFYDPVAAGSHLDNEIRALADGGTIWIYGLLGQVGTVDVTPLIRKSGAIRGWSLSDMIQTGGPEALQAGYEHILDGFARGIYQQHLAASFPLSQAADAHRFMEQGGHVGKIVLVPEPE